MTFDQHIECAERWLATVDCVPPQYMLAAERIAVANAHTAVAVAVFNRESMTKLHEAQAAAFAKLDE